MVEKEIRGVNVDFITAAKVVSKRLDDLLCTSDYNNFPRHALNTAYVVLQGLITDEEKKSEEYIDEPSKLRLDNFGNIISEEIK